MKEIATHGQIFWARAEKPAETASSQREAELGSFEVDDGLGFVKWQRRRLWMHGLGITVKRWLGIWSFRSLIFPILSLQLFFLSSARIFSFLQICESLGSSIVDE